MMRHDGTVKVTVTPFCVMQCPAQYIPQKSMGKTLPTTNCAVFGNMIDFRNTFDEFKQDNDKMRHDFNQFS